MTKKFPNKYLLNSPRAFFSLFTICCHLYIQYLIFLHNRCHSLYPLLVNTLLHNKKDVCQIMLCVLYLFQNRKSKHKSTSLAFFRWGRRRNNGSIGVVIWRRPSERKKKIFNWKNKVITYDNRLKNYQSNTRDFVKRLSYFKSAYQYVLPLHCLRSLT